LPRPRFNEIFAVDPIPISIPKAKRIDIIGIVIPTPVNASEPTSGIRPINILSTILYKALTNIPIIAGIEYFNKSFPIDSSPKWFWCPIIFFLLII